MASWNRIDNAPLNKRVLLCTADLGLKLVFSARYLVPGSLSGLFPNDPRRAGWYYQNNFTTWTPVPGIPCSWMKHPYTPGFYEEEEDQRVPMTHAKTASAFVVAPERESAPMPAPGDLQVLGPDLLPISEALHYTKEQAEQEIEEWINEMRADKYKWYSCIIHDRIPLAELASYCRIHRIPKE